MALIVPPGVPGITFQTPLQNGLTISDVPGPTGGILIKTTTGAMVSVSDTGIIISNGQSGGPIESTQCLTLENNFDEDPKISNRRSCSA